jgi:hypothetical protein
VRQQANVIPGITARQDPHRRLLRILLKLNSTSVKQEITVQLGLLTKFLAIQEKLAPTIKWETPICKLVKLVIIAHREALVSPRLSAQQVITVSQEVQSPLLVQEELTIHLLEGQLWHNVSPAQLEVIAKLQL